MTIRFVALETDLVRRLQAGGPDANGHAPERQISDGGGIPCRYTLKMVPKGETYLIVSHRPFPAPQPYAEQGPIFISATATERHMPSAEIPEFLKSPRYIVRGYSADHRIVYGSGQIVQTPEIPSYAGLLFENRDIAYAHVRSATNNCYHCRIERA